MRNRPLIHLGAALLLSTAPLAASAEDLIVFHNWSSKAEVPALYVLKSGLEAKGDTWTDLAIPHRPRSAAPCLEQRNLPNTRTDTVSRDLSAPPGVGAARPGQPAEGEPAGGKTCEPRRVEAAVALSAVTDPENGVVELDNPCLPPLIAGVA